MQEEIEGGDVFWLNDNRRVCGRAVDFAMIGDYHLTRNPESTRSTMESNVRVAVPVVGWLRRA